MSDDHVAVPPPPKRSVINRKGKDHQTNCAGWINNKKPWPCNSHHILPVTCFNPIAVDPKDKLAYVKRCVLVSKWDINGGNRFKFSGDENNTVRLPLYSAYYNAYPASATGKFKRQVYPVNECMHNSRYSEHYLYNREVREYLQKTIWSKLQEDKAKHKGKGKDILTQLTDATKEFRQRLQDRGQRTTQNGNQGTVNCWLKKDVDPEWMLPFSMASDADTLYPL